MSIVYCLSALWMHHVVHNCYSIMAPPLQLNQHTMWHDDMVLGKLQRPNRRLVTPNGGLESWNPAQSDPFFKFSSSNNILPRYTVYTYYMFIIYKFRLNKKKTPTCHIYLPTMVVEFHPQWTIPTCAIPCWENSLRLHGQMLIVKLGGGIRWPFHQL